MNSKNFLFLLCLIWTQPLITSANRVRNLAAEGADFDPKETSPSPSPSENGRVDGNPPDPGVVREETCDLDFNQCYDNAQNITACLLAKAGDVSKETILLVQNDGENSLKLYITVLPVNSTLDAGDVLGHQEKKINVSSNASRSEEIVLNTANWSCKIRRKGRVPLIFPAYITKIKPMKVVYLVFGTSLLLGVMWACCTFGKDPRKLDGIPYQELEMGNQETGVQTNEETADVWDQNWDDDDDWDLEMTVKQPERNEVANGVGLKSASNGNGWGNDWIDDEEEIV